MRSRLPSVSPRVPTPTLPNGVSLLAAEPRRGPHFFLQMVDHLFAGPGADEALAQPPSIAGREAACSSIAPRFHLDLDDATKVRLDGRSVRAIGKGLEPWDAIDAGCFLLTRPCSMPSAPLRPTSRARCRGHAATGRGWPAGTADVDGIDWIDVDTPSDLAIAERLIDAPVGATAPRP